MAEGGKGRNKLDILELVSRVKVIVEVFDMLERATFHQETYLAPSMLFLTVVFLDLLLPLILSSLETCTCLILDLSGSSEGFVWGLERCRWRPHHLE
jgi:hypothetical protein